jgi:hypothetical protein
LPLRLPPLAAPLSCWFSMPPAFIIADYTPPPADTPSASDIRRLRQPRP